MRASVGAKPKIGVAVHSSSAVLKLAATLVKVVDEPRVKGVHMRKVPMAYWKAFSDSLIPR